MDYFLSFQWHKTMLDGGHVPSKLGKIKSKFAEMGSVLLIHSHNVTFMSLDIHMYK